MQWRIVNDSRSIAYRRWARRLLIFVLTWRGIQTLPEGFNLSVRLCACIKWIEENFPEDTTLVTRFVVTSPVVQHPMPRFHEQHRAKHNDRYAELGA